ncbi:MAG: flagellar hook-basal body complex protein [Campylobacterales bacterium]
MTQGFYTGLSGIKTYQTAIDVTSDNLANVNTVGFRSTTTEFANLYEKTLNMTTSPTTNTEDVGVGSRVNTISMMQDYGSLILTDKSTDLAIHDDGWFAIQSNGEPLYTRAGNFTFDANSDLVTPDGFHVLGTMGGNIKDGVLTEKLSEVDLDAVDAQVPLNFPQTLTYPPEPTKTAKMIGNISVEDEVRTLGAGVVDAEGNKNNLQIKFTKKEEQVPPGSQWNAVATIKSLDGDTIYSTVEEVVEFNEDGSLKNNPFTTIDNNGSPINIDLGTGYDGVVSIDNYDITSSSMADGTVGGDLVSYELNQNAEVIATFTNGVQSSVGKIAVFHFQNDQGLERISGTRFGQTSNSGEAIFFQDENGKDVNGTKISNYRLESSNTRVEVGLTDLIIMQRAFDANSKSITTADEMIQKALQMDA